MTQLYARKRRKVGPLHRKQKRIIRGIGKQHLGVRKSKNSIPTPNPDPQPPNSNQQQNNNANSQLQNQAQSQTNNQPTQQTPNNDAFSSYQPQAGKPDPRDETYWRDVTRLNFERNQERSKLDLENIYSNTAYEQALEQRARQHPRDILATRINASRAGNIYSSVHQEDLGQLEQEYFESGADLDRQRQQETANRGLIRQALDAGYTIDEAAALAQAIDRQSQQELNQPPPPGPAQQNPLITPQPNMQYPQWMLDMAKGMKRRNQLSAKKSKKVFKKKNKRNKR